MKQTAIMLSKQASKINYVLNPFCLRYLLSRDAVQQLLYIEIFCERRCANMEKYAKAQMEVIEFENEVVITASIAFGNCPFDKASGCPLDQVDCLDAD